MIRRLTSLISPHNASPVHSGWLSLIPLDPTWRSLRVTQRPELRVRREEAAARARVLVSRFRVCRWRNLPMRAISAIDLNKGEILWQIAHGETPDNIRNHPALKGLNIPRTGRPGVFGSVVTKTLVVAGERGTFTTPSGQVGAMLRAYDKATGTERGAVYMPAGQTGTPMTYMLNGKQYTSLPSVGRASPPS